MIRGLSTVSMFKVTKLTHMHVLGSGILYITLYFSFTFIPSVTKVGTLFPPSRVTSITHVNYRKFPMSIVNTPGIVEKFIATPI